MLLRVYLCQIVFIWLHCFNTCCANGLDVPFKWGQGSYSSPADLSYISSKVPKLEYPPGFPTHLIPKLPNLDFNRGEGVRDLLAPHDTLLNEVLSKVEQLGDNSIYTVEHLIEKEGYPVETHHITNTDGYILTLHRIPRGKTNSSNGKVAYLQHGLISSSADWVIRGQGAIAFELADAGYDVWMGNARGNTQSRHHVKYNPKYSEFWQFSWHEIGVVDIPQMIDYVLRVAQVSQVYYIGHSQGTTSFFVMASTLPEYNDKIKVQISLAPIAFMNHMTSPLLQIISQWSGPLDTLTALIGVNEFLPNTAFLRFVLGDVVCKEDAISQFLCTNAQFAICGFSRKQMNTTLLPWITKYSPAGSSTKQFLHYGQEIKSGYFRQYDHGVTGNFRRYQQLAPPSYDLSKITAPVHLFYSSNDWLSAEVDVEKLCIRMGSGCRETILVRDAKWNHLDYVYGIDAPKLVYEKVMEVMSRF